MYLVQIILFAHACCIDSDKLTCTENILFIFFPAFELCDGKSEARVSWVFAYVASAVFIINFVTTQLPERNN